MPTDETGAYSTPWWRRLHIHWFRRVTGIRQLRFPAGAYECRCGLVRFYRDENHHALYGDLVSHRKDDDER